jgi:hypothetical protein
LAHPLHRLGALGYTRETSLLKTLAGPGRTTGARTLKRLQSTPQTPTGPRQCLQRTMARPGTTPLIAIFGGLSLQRKPPAIQDQVVRPYRRRRAERVARLLHDTCDGCGSKEPVERHHIRHLAALHKRGRREQPLWMPIRSARNRKSIPLCRRCHMDVHDNRPQARRQGNERAVCHERGQHGLEGDRGKRQSTLTSPAVYPTNRSRSSALLVCVWTRSSSAQASAGLRSTSWRRRSSVRR